MAEDVNKEVKEAEEKAKAAEAAAEEARKEADRLAEKAKEEAESKKADEAKKAEDEAKKAAEAREAEVRKKAEEDAAKAAAAAEAARKQREVAASAKEAKKKEKKEKLNALKAACPSEFKPVSTSAYFWVGILCWLPFVGLIITLILSIAPKNKNLKSFVRSKLAYYVIFLISFLIIALVAGAVIPEDNRIEIVNAILKICRSLGMYV